MEKDYLNEYRKSIRKQYEIQKNGIHNNFLLNPTAANLRDLCILVFKENSNKDDLTSFRLYFGFDFTIKTAHELNDDKRLNKLKSLGKFLKGKSELKNINGLDLAALFVDFQNRPYNKFSKSYIKEKALTSGQSEPINGGIENPIPEVLPKTPTEDKKTIWFKTNGLKIASGCVIMAILFLGVHYFMKGEECMEWVNDHYEVVDCDVPNESGDRYISAKEEDSFIADFKKINPCDTLSFKDKNGNACLWYGKSLTGEMEFFNKLALHPETKKSLKEVSAHIFNTYIKDKPCE